LEALIFTVGGFLYFLFSSLASLLARSASNVPLP